MSAFESVLKVVEEWQPEALPSELRYRDSLTALLRERLQNVEVETEYRHQGTTTDIYVKQSGFLGSTDVFVELKRNLLQKAQLDRLVGQVESLQPRKHAIIVVLCGGTNPALVSRFKERYKLSGDYLILGSPMTVVLKEGSAKAAQAG
jgi:hypothetical protein